MCGIFSIINYIPNKQIITDTIDGINILSNRGRDSFGILLHNKENKMLK